MSFKLNLFGFFRVKNKMTSEDKVDCHVEVAHYTAKRKVKRSRSVDIALQSSQRKSTQTDASGINDAYVEDADIAAIDCDLKGKHLKDRRRALFINEYLEIERAGITIVMVSARHPGICHWCRRMDGRVVPPEQNLIEFLDVHCQCKPFSHIKLTPIK